MPATTRSSGQDPARSIIMSLTERAKEAYEKRVRLQDACTEHVRDVLELEEDLGRDNRPEKRTELKETMGRLVNLANHYRLAHKAFAKAEMEACLAENPQLNQAGKDKKREQIDRPYTEFWEDMGRAITRVKATLENAEAAAVVTEAATAAAAAVDDSPTPAEETGGGGESEAEGGGAEGGAGDRERNRPRRHSEGNEQAIGAVAKLLGDLVSTLNKKETDTMTQAAHLANVLQEDRREARRQQENAYAMIRVPHVDCEVFTGADDQEYARWKTAFLQIYPSSIPPAERFLGLQGKTGGAAKELLMALPVTGASYAEGIKRLDEKYGTSSYEIARLNRQFRAEPPVTRTEDTVALRSLYEKVRSMVFTYRELKEPLAGPYMIEVWLDKFPKSIAWSWVKATSGEADDGSASKAADVDAFLKLVAREVKQAESYQSLLRARTKPEKEKEKEKPNKPEKKGDGGNSQGKAKPASSASLLAASDGGGAGTSGKSGSSGKSSSGKSKKTQPVNITCQDCRTKKSGHGLDTCQAFQKLTLGQKKRWCFALGSCMRCLKGGHWAKNCASPVKCTASGCGKPDFHHPMLHH